MIARATTPPTVAPAMIPAFCVEVGGAGDWLGLGDALAFDVVVDDPEEDSPAAGKNTAAVAGSDDKMPAVTFQVDNQLQSNKAQIYNNRGKVVA